MKKIDLRNQKLVKQLLDDAYLNILVDPETIWNPLRKIPDEFAEYPHLYIQWLMTQPEYFHFMCREIMNIDLQPFQCVILKEMWNRKFPFLIGSRGMSKSFLLSLYTTLRLLILRNRKVVVCGAAFRQSKILFEYMKTFYGNAPLLRDIIHGMGASDVQGPHRDVDMCTFVMGDSLATFLPIGSGEKIRGQRANDIITDEINSINQEILEKVIFGFAAVKASPSEGVKQEAQRAIISQLGLNQVVTGDELYRENQIIMSGTCGFTFQHMYTYWKKWHNIIMTRGDRSKLEEVFNGEIPPGFNWTDYSIMRIPFESLPRGFMDEGIVAQARASVDNAQYLMEYSACCEYNTPIITSDGIKKIGEVQVDDLVLTHKGRFKKVTKKCFRRHKGQIVKYKTYGSNYEYNITPNHPYWTSKEEFEELDNINTTYLVNLKELNNETNLNLESILPNILETNDGQYFYPMGGPSIINLSTQRDIKQSSLTQVELAKIHNMKQSSISSIVRNKKSPKNKIPQNIPLNYEFGLIVGYYASEGSCGSRGRSVNFALDEHKDTDYQTQLINAIKSVFHFEPKVYNKDNVSAITINSRLAVDLFKHICPGVAINKLIKHDILFSNPDFMRGVIEGFWNGDGHIRYGTAKGGSICCSLLNQIRMCLSYFNISSSLLLRSPAKNPITNNCQPAYELNIHGENFRKFILEFYGQDYLERLSQKINNDGEKSEFKILKKEYVDFDDYVYNLEVEDDHSYSLLNATVHNCFSGDSNGFFKRSLIESCTVTNSNKISHKSEQDIMFYPLLYGNKDYKYVYGIDPASESDKFAIVILEIHPEHRRLVYSWTSNKKDFQEDLKEGHIKHTNDFYTYCLYKIRDLMKRFPCDLMVMDAQGGGYMIAEGLKSKDLIKDGEMPILPVIIDGKPQDTDGLAGLHILELSNNGDYKWYAQANHGLRKDMEDKALLFPHVDPTTLELATISDNIAGRLVDRLDDVVLEIEELKNELSTIVHSATPSGRERWDTPEIKLAGKQKGRLRKDRYSALFIANMGARVLQNSEKIVFDFATGDFAGSTKANSGRTFTGPAWMVDKLNDLYSD